MKNEKKINDYAVRRCSMKESTPLAEKLGRNAHVDVDQVITQYNLVNFTQARVSRTFLIQQRPCSIFY